MADSKYCLSWNSYENNICNGLAKLQQGEEFVDMTLVADGHLVKVHKNLLALASPYIKQMIRNIPCEHPIIFFSNMSHETLCYILEYIYTGQVQVEIEKLQSFLTAAKELCLPSISNVNVNVLSSTVENNVVNIQPEVEEPIIANFDLQIQNQSNINDNIVETPIILQHNETVDISDVNNLSDLIKINNPRPVERDIPSSEMLTEEIYNTVEINKPIELKIDTDAYVPHQYTVSNRGSLQLILHRYIYSSHHQALQGRKRRWRCIDYRFLHCKAFIDTMNDKITKRKNIHSHPFHDGKIMKKIKDNLIFGSISTALSAATKLNSLKNAEKIEDSE